jgi:ribonuclease G
MLKKILINSYPWLTRVAVLRNNKLQDIYFDSHSKKELEKCFFKGKISKVLPGIQTTFVDIKQERAGFLHISEIDRALAAEKMPELSDEESIGSANFAHALKQAMDIGKIFKEGEEVLVQVIKEPVYEKGAKLTTCFTLPGKLVVLMPNIPQIGISKKIESKEERTRLREIISKNLPAGMGAILRTTAEGRTEKDINHDLSLLISTWKSIQKRFKTATIGEMIHEDLPITLRAIREHLDDDIEAVLIDSVEDQKAVYKFVKNAMPEQISKIKLYEAPNSLFAQFDIDKQINEALQKKVILKSGGSLIIESTEAMTVIDVNTGRYIGKSNLEETILKTNLEAAEEIIRQLRLRNIGGIIVIDFIDMANQTNKQKLSRFLEKTSREQDKLQSVALKVSEFGLIQMTRKRTGKTLVHQLMNECPMCHGAGFIKSTNTISCEILKKFYTAMQKQQTTGNIILSVPNKIFDYLIHNEFQSIIRLEKLLHNKIILESNERLEDTEFAIFPQKDKKSNS